MDLFERVKLLVRSTLSGGLPEMPMSSKGNPQKMLDKAEAKLEILRDDLARAEKKGNDELSGKLKTEIADLEKLIAKARGKAQPASTTPTTQSAAASAQAQSVKIETSKEVVKPATETPQETAKTNEVVIDETRVADQLKKLRERK